MTISVDDEHNIITVTTIVLGDEAPCRSNTTSPNTDTTITESESTNIPSSTISHLEDTREVIDKFEEKVRKRRSVKSVSLTGALQDFRRKSLTLLDISSWKVSMEQFQNSFDLYCFVFEDFISRKDGRRVFQEYLKNVVRSEGLTTIRFPF